jgi:hypothetical protein
MHARLVARLREHGYTLEEIKQAGEDGRLAFGYRRRAVPVADGKYCSTSWPRRPASNPR